MKKEKQITPTLIVWEKISHSYDTFRRRKITFLTEHHLTLPQYNVLEMLFVNGSMPLKKMANEMNVTPANITCVVDNLEKQGYAERVPVKEDRRIILARLTLKGKKKIEKLVPDQQKEIASLVNLLTEEEQQLLNRLLSKFV